MVVFLCYVRGFCIVRMGVVYVGVDGDFSICR